MFQQICSKLLLCAKNRIYEKLNKNIVQSVSAKNGGREPKCITDIWDFGARPAGIKIKMMYCLKSLR